ncbi:H-NS family nucleoid-associated regulatory protein [Rhodoblastus sphagnicola]|nr:H-NS histone family protein [Rhodoblastus sphagnicola]
MEKLDINSMSVDELWSLHEEISELLSARIHEQKRVLEERLAVLNGGATATEIPRAAPKPARRKYPKVLPRYRNPESAETWSGRGKRPRWLVAAMKAGRDMQEFLISS